MKTPSLPFWTHLAALLAGMALSLLILPRWQVTTAIGPIESKLIRIDRWTGTVETRDLYRSGAWLVEQPAP
jgi:hypothetical protein